MRIVRVVAVWVERVETRALVQSARRAPAVPRILGLASREVVGTLAGRVPGWLRPLAAGTAAAGLGILAGAGVRRALPRPRPLRQLPGRRAALPMPRPALQPRADG